MVGWSYFGTREIVLLVKWIALEEKQKNSISVGPARKVKDFKEVKVVTMSDSEICKLWFKNMTATSERIQLIQPFWISNR
jgi:hypothetical protein